MIEGNLSYNQSLDNNLNTKDIDQLDREARDHLKEGVIVKIVFNNHNLVILKRIIKTINPKEKDLP